MLLEADIYFDYAPRTLVKKYHQKRVARDLGVKLRHLVFSQRALCLVERKPSGIAYAQNDITLPCALLAREQLISVALRDIRHEEHSLLAQAVFFYFFLYVSIKRRVVTKHALGVAGTVFFKIVGVGAAEYLFKVFGSFLFHISCLSVIMRQEGEDMDLAQRLEISYYEPVAELKSGHNVYLVRHRETGSIGVKKVMDVYNIHVYEFLRDHPIDGTPRIMALCEENGRLTVIEEYISGSPLSNIMENTALTPDRIRKYICRLCDILSRLHSQHPPLIHRDIKPSNIIITPRDDVVLIDFNAAKQFTDANTEDTVLLGTKGYAAPEQYGFGSSAPQTDIYATGVLLRQLNSSLYEDYHGFDAVIEKCTRIDPADRYKSAKELKAAIAPHGDPGEPVSLVPPGFRSGTPWKMLVASLAYIAIFSMCVTLQVENTTGVMLWLNRLACLTITLFAVLSPFDYLGVQRFMPLCASSNKYIHFAGLVVLDSIVMMVVLTVLYVLEYFL